MKTNREIEVRFLEVDKSLLIKKLISLGAQDRGEDLLEETIFYDKNYKWRDVENKFVRLRKNNTHVSLAYKHHQQENVDGVEEIEFDVSDAQKAEFFLEKLGLVAYRHQQKKRHSFLLDGVVVDIDTWPRIPTYVELEGSSESELKRIAKKLELEWEDALFESARTIIEQRYNIPVGSMEWFTFHKFK